MSVYKTKNLKTIGENNHGVLTSRPGTLSNDFFVKLLNQNIEWIQTSEHTYEGKDRTSGTTSWTATDVDLIFGANSQLRALCEVYAESGSGEKFINEFISAWNQVMEADRFDLHN